MKRVSIDCSDSDKKSPATTSFSYDHLYEKKLQFRFVQCEFNCYVCDFKCTDEEQMQNHISDHSLRDVNSALSKDKNINLFDSQ